MNLTYTIQELEALCAAATTGPWEWGDADGLASAVAAGSSRRLLCSRCSLAKSQNWGDADGDHLISWNKPGGGLIILEVNADAVQPLSADAKLIAVARTAIPELIAKIRELDPSFNATPLADSVARAQELMREAGEKRAKLASAVAAAKLGSLEELNALGLEAFFEADGSVKVRQKQRKAAGT